MHARQIAHLNESRMSHVSLTYCALGMSHMWMSHKWVMFLNESCCMNEWMRHEWVLLHWHVARSTCRALESVMSYIWMGHVSYTGKFQEERVNRVERAQKQFEEQVHCYKLQQTASRCIHCDALNTLQFEEQLDCNALRDTATRCNILQHTAVGGAGILQPTATCCNTHWNTPQHSKCICTHEHICVCKRICMYT